MPIVTHSARLAVDGGDGVPLLQPHAARTVARPPSPPRIVVNIRNLSAPLTGVQRYTHEVMSRLGEAAVAMGPYFNARGKAGHLWEQCVLPAKLQGRLLWSPANTGPLLVRNQILSLHDLSMFDQPEGFTRAISRWYRALLPRLAPRVLGVIVSSAFTRDRLIMHCRLPPSRVKVIHLGVSSRFTPAAYDARLIERLGLPGRRYVLSLGSLEPRKNLPMLVRAWQLAADRLPSDLHLVIAGGTGPTHIFTGVDLPAAPRMHIAGRIADADLPALVAGAEGFVYPSLYEGFGLPPLEAMASGVPVLSSNRTAMPEVLGNAALLVDPTDPRAIAHGLAHLIDDRDLRALLRARGHDLARRLTWERCLRTTRDHLIDMLGASDETTRWEALRQPVQVRSTPDIARLLPQLQADSGSFRQLRLRSGTGS